MHPRFSNIALDLQAEVNRLTRPYRRRRQYRRKWHDDSQYCTGHLWSDCALAIIIAFVFLGWVIA